jgi:hypothetical protein
MVLQLHNMKERDNIMQIRVIETFEVNLQSRAAYTWTAEDGTKTSMDAVPERKATCCLAEVMDGSGVTIQFELPGTYSGKVSKEDVLHVDCKQAQNVGSFFRIKNVFRHISQKKG